MTNPEYEIGQPEMDLWARILPFIIGVLIALVLSGLASFLDLDLLTLACTIYHIIILSSFIIRYLRQKRMSRISVEISPVPVSSMTSIYGSDKRLQSTNVDSSVRQIRLVIESSADARISGKTIAIDHLPFSIGRSNRDVSLDDPQVSRQHAEIILLDDQIHLVDTHSTHGTILNGKRLLPAAPTLLHSGDEIVVGESRLKYLEDVPVLAQVRFTSYCPDQVQPSTKYSLYLYAHLNEERIKQAVESNIQKYADELGGAVPAPKAAKQIAFLRHETQITVVPECDEIEFNPTALTKRWDGEWVKFEFDFKVSDAYLDEILFIRISIRVENIEIAFIKTVLNVVQQQSTAVINPLAAAKLKSQTTTTYQRIFISYSRRDSQVARAFKFAQTALGNEVFLDVDNLRSGENWRAALARAIDEADIFQLFWSEHSASSEYCQYEWDYALNYRCPENKCEGFIRPVYWQQPIPAPPKELAHLNFRYVPFQSQND